MSERPIETVQLARQSMRRSARLLKQNASDIPTHSARLKAAMMLTGSEPVQGVMADLFVTFGEDQSTVKRDALQLIRARLAAHVASWFESQIHAPALPIITPLATRWSILSIPSADISTRARRCSVDDSHALAAQVVSAVAQGGVQEQQLFLHHCVTCHDNLAFMLARRALLKMNTELPPGWELVSHQLEHAMETTSS
jgi:mono/diheme cytochrome c family protein